MSRESEAAGRTEGTARRSLLKGTAGAAILGVSGLGAGAWATETAEPGAAVKNGRIQQSIVHWCFEKYWPIDEFIKSAKSLGVGSIELLPAKYFPQNLRGYCWRSNRGETSWV
jgi:hydroxypyruvate isomerase